MTEEFYKTSSFLPNSKNVIPYFKHLRLITGSVTASILMQQIEYWFSKTHGPFYKFLSPLKEGNGYKAGDSWTEELGFSKAEFRSAFSKIGIAYKSKGQFDHSKDKFQGKMYCSYYDRIARKTWYFRSKQVEVNLEKLRKLILRNEQSSFAEAKNVDLHFTETTSEITTEKKTPPIAPQGASEKTSYALVSGKSKAEIDLPREIPISDLDYEFPLKNKPSKITPPPWMNQKDWHDLLEIRRKAKAINTPRALKVYTKELNKAHQHGWTSERLVDEIATHGWRGFKYEWLERAQRQKPKMDPRHDPSSPEFMPD